MKYKLTDVNGNSIDDYADDDFNKNFRRNKSIKLKDGNIYQNGELIGHYERLSFDDFGPRAQGVYNELSARRNASYQAIGGFTIGTAVVGATGGVAAYYAGSLGTITTLGGLGRAAAPAAAGGGAVLNQLGRTDASIFQKAIQFGASATNSFANNLSALADAVRSFRPDAQVTKIGQIGNSPVFGSLRSGVGIAEVDGVTVVVKMVRGTPQVLGPLP